MEKEVVFLLTITQYQIRAVEGTFHGAGDLYSAHLHIHAPVGEKAHALRFQEAALDLRAAEGVAGADAAVAEDHAVAGDDAGFRVAVQCKAHATCAAGVSRECGDMPVGHDPPGGYGAHDLVDPAREVRHCAI